MASLSVPHPICLGFQTAIDAHRLMSIDGIEHRATRSPLPSQPPRQTDLLRALHQLERFGMNRGASLPLHVLTSTTARCRHSSLCHPHACTFPLPASNFFMLAPELLCSKPALAFVQMASRLSLASLLMLGYELCGSYRLDLRTNDVIFQVNPILSCREIHAFVQKHPYLNGAKKAAQALRFLADGSASPRETQAAILFALPKHFGGYGFGTPAMNRTIKANAKARNIAGRHSFRCDLCWPSAQLDVEYQSQEFHEGEGNRIRDSRRTNALMAMGFNVVSITNKELESLRATDVIAGTIAKAIGKRMRKDTRNQMLRKLALRKDLGLPA